MIVVDPIKEYAVESIKPGARHAGRRWCHLEDTESDVERLHAFAKRIGIPRRWFQIGVRGTFPHYDLTPRYRLRAISAGAVALSSEQSKAETHYRFRTNRHFPKGDRRYGKKIDASGRIVGVYAGARDGRAYSVDPLGMPENRRRARPARSAAETIPLPGFLDDSPDDSPR